MTLKTSLIAYIATIIAYLVLDGIWLGIIAKDSYQTEMNGLFREHYPVWPWVTFYITYCAAIVYLVIAPNHQKGVKQIALSGAVLGMAAYGAYNLTCYAIVEGWPLSITLKDWAWGITVTTLSSVTGYVANSHFKQ